MNKLISKNPVLRFKEGKKIIKAKWGDAAPYPIDFRDPKGNPYAGMWYNENGKPVGTALIYNNELVRLIDSETPFYESAYLVNTPYYQTLSNNKYRGSRDFVNSYEKTGGHPTIDKKTLPKGNSSKANKLANNIFIKGFQNRRGEIKDVRAMLKKLMELGLLKDRFGADGKWGKNTEAAYLKYLTIKNIPEYTPFEHISPAELMGIPTSEESTPLYQRIRFKQGGLISKNPVERFKLGKKIVKALGGTKVIATVDGRQFETTVEQARKNGWEYFVPSELAKFNRNYPYDKYATSYRLASPDFPATIQDARFGDYSGVRSGLVADLEMGNFDWLPRKVRVPYVPTLKSQSNSSAQDVDTQNTLSKTTESLTQSKSNFLNNKSGSQKFTKGKSRKTSITPSVFAGHRIGRTGGLNYNINNTDKQLLIGTGQFTESDFKNALATQQALNRYFANSGLGSIKEDNAWGDQSRAALALALSKSKSLTPFNNETTIVKTPIIPTYTPPTIPVNLEIANLKLNVNVPQQTYDRTGVREFIRNKGLNPYSFTGALRRALRMVMNGLGTDNDKLLIKGMGLFKKGGQLPSRNIVERFKNKI